MKNKSGLIWGIVLILVGFLFIGKILGFLEFNIFFDGWWTLFIIIPCLIGLINDSDKTGSLIGIIIGVMLLLGARNIIDFGIVWKLLLPIIIVIIGISLIIKSFFGKSIEQKIKDGVTSSCKDGYTAVFSGQNIKINEEEFKGTNITTVFGGIEFDLRNAIIKEDFVINAVAIFGGIDIYVPDDVKVEIKSTSFLGGVDNKKREKDNKKTHTIYIDATCVFGGIDIK